MVIRNQSSESHGDSLGFTKYCSVLAVPFELAPFLYIYCLCCESGKADAANILFGREDIVYSLSMHVGYTGGTGTNWDEGWCQVLAWYELE